MADFQRPEKKKTILDLRAFGLQTPCPTKGVKAISTLRFDVNGKNQPLIVVYTNDPGDKDNNYGKIVAKLDPKHFFLILTMIKKVMETKEEVKYDLEITDFTFKNRQRSEAPQPIAKVWVGRDAAGVMWMSVEDLDIRGRIKIKFPFTASYLNFIHKNGELLNDQDGSELVAEGLATLLTQILPTLLVTNYVPEEPKQQQGGNNQRGNGGGGGGYQNNRNNGGGGKPSYDSNDSDDLDIPF